MRVKYFSAVVIKQYCRLLLNTKQSIQCTLYKTADNKSNIYFWKNVYNVIENSQYSNMNGDNSL